ncbi:hypothetical protein ACLQ29_11605 [Micromonospora sp. DT228]|uniref:hypothetical protein n=1 Tax=Micromonospora sp. DT228 TaxID=3393443 RepID=UPI003CFA360A
MFATLARGVVRHPWWTIGAWLIVAVLVGVFGPGLSSSNDQAEFLPAHYESVQAGKVQDVAFAESGGGSAGTFVVQRRYGDQTVVAGVSPQIIWADAPARPAR